MGTEGGESVEGGELWVVTSRIEGVVVYGNDWVGELNWGMIWDEGEWVFWDAWMAYIVTNYVLCAETF